MVSHLILTFALLVAAKEPPIPELYDVARVIDGDTIVIQDLDGEQVTVRLVGVNAPEINKRQPCSEAARTYVHYAVTGRKVRLIPDQAAGDHDVFNRRLAYVMVDGVCINEEVVRRGLGIAYTKYKFEPATRLRFRILEQIAREAKIGIWSDHPEP